MSRAGFVLVGGKSSRMGRDKALLPYRDTVLAERIAREVEAAAGSVTLVGDPERYLGLGRPVIPDLRAGCGPLGGIEAVLSASIEDWNLVVACDMPGVLAPFLTTLLAEAGRAGGDCLLPLSGPELPEPLCAVYHRRCLPAIRGALDANVRKVTEALAGVRVVHWMPPEPGWADNLNTREDLRSHRITTRSADAFARDRESLHGCSQRHGRGRRSNG